MIVAEKKPVTASFSTVDRMDIYNRFGDAMPDGRLTEPGDGKVYRLREAILLSKRLGRPLTDSEMKQFEIM